EQKARRIRLPVGVERDNILRRRAPVDRVAEPQVRREGCEDDEDDHDSNAHDSDAALLEERPCVQEVPTIGPKEFLRQIPIDFYIAVRSLSPFARATVTKSSPSTSSSEFRMRRTYPAKFKMTRFARGSDMCQRMSPA